MVTTQVWWFLARSSGLVAWGAGLASILWGLALSTRALGRQPRPAWLLDLHRLLGGLCVGFVGLHLVALLADSFVELSPADLVVPWHSSYRSTDVAWGVLALWLLVAVEVSSLLQRALSRRVWRGIHLASYAVAVLATAHAVGTGTDVDSPLFRWTALAGLGAIGFFTIYRLLAPGGMNPARDLSGR
jgi:DMSO/TMAO reductase YedYZ heme-binding membrane subunit